MKSIYRIYRSIDAAGPYSFKARTANLSSKHGKPLRTPASSSACSSLQNRRKSTRSSVEKESGQQRRIIAKDGLSFNDFVGDGRFGTAQIVPSAPANVVADGFLSFAIKTYGCQMNVNDTDIVRSILLDAGYVESHDEDAADVWHHGQGDAVPEAG